MAGDASKRVESSRAYVRERVIECLKGRSSLSTWKVSVFVGGGRGRKVVSSAWHGKLSYVGGQGR
jgi:hypothetical protein